MSELNEKLELAREIVEKYNPYLGKELLYLHGCVEAKVMNASYTAYITIHDDQMHEGYVEVRIEEGDDTTIFLVKEDVSIIHYPHKAKLLKKIASEYNTTVDVVY